MIALSIRQPWAWHIRFDSEEEARQGIRRLRRSTGCIAWLTPYRCQFCNGFHFGHPPKNVRQAIR